MKDFITKRLLSQLGFKLVSYKKSEFSTREVMYGYAIDRTGMTTINWATDGHSVTYFGEPLADNIGVCIKKDGGTRTAFNGYCFNESDFRKVLQLTW